MNKILNILLAFLAVSTPCVARTLPDDPRLYPVFIAHDRGAGSGCLLQLSNSIYLATAKHVLFEHEQGTNAPRLLADTAMISCFNRGSSNDVKKEAFKLDLVRLQTDGEIRYSSNRDVVLVRINEILDRTNKTSRMLPGFNFITRERDLTLFFPDTMNN